MGGLFPGGSCIPDTHNDNTDQPVNFTSPLHSVTENVSEGLENEGPVAGTRGQRGHLRDPGRCTGVTVQQGKSMGLCPGASSSLASY